MQEKLSRRTLSKLCVAAFGGALAGTLGTACSKEGAQTPPSEAKLPPAEEIPSEELLLSEPHVCRGLNTCKGLGAGGQNECAGQGSCATANEHLCHAMNECKGQGGCGSTSGVNSCKGTGECGVPLSSKTWKTTRAAFESAMDEAGRDYAAAPAEESS